MSKKASKILTKYVGSLEVHKTVYQNGIGEFSNYLALVRMEYDYFDKAIEGMCHFDLLSWEDYEQLSKEGLNIFFEYMDI